MNIVFSHGFKIKNDRQVGAGGDSVGGLQCSSPSGAELENYLFNEYPEGFVIDSETEGPRGAEFEGVEGGNYQCSTCIGKDFKHSEFLEKETSKLYKTCNKYKNKLEIIRENINNIIKENEEEDAFFEDQKEAAASATRLEQVDKRIILDDLLEEEEIDLPPLGFF